MTFFVVSTPETTSPEPFRSWNLGKLVGQKPPLKLREVWAIRIRLQIQKRLRDLAMFNLAIDSKLRGCDLVALRVDDVLLSGRVRPRTTVIQKKTGRPVQFEITEQTRETVIRCTQRCRKHGLTKPTELMMRSAAFAILLLLAAGHSVAAQETGVLARLTATRALTPPELERTAAVLRERVARIGFHAMVTPAGGGLVLRAPDATDLGPLGPALAQRGVLRLWWAVPFTGALPQNIPAGTLATWLRAPADPDNRLVALALPLSPATESPGFAEVSAMPPDPDAIPSLTLTLDAPGRAAVAAARRAGTVLTLTIDDEVLAVAPLDTPGDAVTIDRAQVGFFGRSLPAIIRSGPLPARLVVDSARFLRDSPASGLIFANPPQPARQRLDADPALPSAALPVLAASLQAGLGRLAIWGAQAAPDGTGGIRLMLDNRRDLAAIPALGGPLPSWHWGRFELPGASPQPGGPSTLGALPALDGERLRLEDAAALRPDDVIAAEIIRPADEDDGTTITLALELRPGAAGTLREQFRARGGLRLFAVLDGRARQGPFAPTLTADNRLLLRSLFDRKELWPTVAPIVRQGLPAGVQLSDGP